MLLSPSPGAPTRSRQCRKSWPRRQRRARVLTGIPARRGMMDSATRSIKQAGGRIRHVRKAFETSKSPKLSARAHEEHGHGSRRRQNVHLRHRQSAEQERISGEVRPRGHETRPKWRSDGCCDAVQIFAGTNDTWGTYSVGRMTKKGPASLVSGAGPFFDFNYSTSLRALAEPEGSPHGASAFVNEAGAPRDNPVRYQTMVAGSRSRWPNASFHRYRINASITSEACPRRFLSSSARSESRAPCT